MTPIRASLLPVTRWKNGAGRKADIAEGPGWTLGYAWLDGDAPFSDYAGHDRTITLLEGAGFALHDNTGHAAVRVAHLHQPTAFDGGVALVCRITDGPLTNEPCRVLNVMTHRATTRHHVAILTGEPRHIPAPDAGHTAMLVCLRGTLAVETATPDGAVTRVMLDHYDAVPLTTDAHIVPGPASVSLLVGIARLAEGAHTAPPG